VPSRKKQPQPYDFRRTVQYYALLIGVIACLNFWLYWIRGSKLALALGFFCILCLVGWLVAARMVLK
jgi:hypothetical protein